MGAARDAQDSHAGHGFVPKLILAGRLTGTLDGRPVVIEADESGLTVSFPSFRSAWAARRTTVASLPALRWLRQARVPLRVRVAGLLTVEVLPTPSAVAKLIVPALVRIG